VPKLIIRGGRARRAASDVGAVAGRIIYPQRLRRRRGLGVIRSDCVTRQTSALIPNPSCSQQATTADALCGNNMARFQGSSESAIYVDWMKSDRAHIALGGS
jgi:hypothetical protein